jgi:RNA-splicing ligase RtcB
VWHRMCRGIVLEHRTRKLGPHESESVAAYCRRAVQLQSYLANANREVADVSMVEALQEVLEREHPEWTVVL